MKKLKTGGRKKGTPNRLTKELRTVLKDVLHNELENLVSNLDALEPKERLEVIVKLIPFVLPKIETVHYKENEPLSYWDDD